MKYLVRFFVVTFIVLICTNSFAEQKIVVLDLTHVLNESTAGKGAQEFLKKTFNENTKKFSDIEEALKKEESDLLGKKTILSGGEDRLYDVPWLVLDCQRAEQQWDWRPERGLVSILEEIAKFADDHPDWLSLTKR